MSARSQLNRITEIYRDDLSAKLYGGVLLPVAHQSYIYDETSLFKFMDEHSALLTGTFPDIRGVKSVNKALICDGFLADPSSSG